MDFVHQNGNGYHTPEESDVDGVSPSSIKTVSKDVSLDSLSIESRGRNSLTPERAPGTSSNTGTLEKDPTKSRLKQRLRHMSGDKEKKILHPPITAPLTKEKIEDFSEFLRQNSYKTADIPVYSLLEFVMHLFILVWFYKSIAFIKQYALFTML